MVLAKHTAEMRTSEEALSIIIFALEELPLQCT